MTLEHILLGMLRAKPASGYQLKREFSESARFFWFAELSQIYPTLKSLERRGFLSCGLEDSERGPKRRVYRVTPEGASKLKQWLASGPQIGRDRFPYVAQIFFLHALDDFEATRAHVEQLRDYWSRTLDALENIDKNAIGQCGASSEMDSTNFHKYAALRAGIHQLRGKLAWCEETLHAIEERSVPVWK